MSASAIHLSDAIRKIQHSIAQVLDPIAHERIGIPQFLWHALGRHNKNLAALRCGRGRSPLFVRQEGKLAEHLSHLNVGEMDGRHLGAAGYFDIAGQQNERVAAVIAETK